MIDVKNISLPNDQPTATTHEILASTAHIMTKMASTATEADVQRYQHSYEALRYIGMQIEEGDFCELEMMLACQANVLSKIFTDATNKYAEAQTQDDARSYAAIALKAQNYCRKTVGTLSQVKPPLIHRGRKMNPLDWNK